MIHKLKNEIINAETAITGTKYHEKWNNNTKIVTIIAQNTPTNKEISKYGIFASKNLPAVIMRHL
jgi:hypothetical protein